MCTDKNPADLFQVVSFTRLCQQIATNLSILSSCNKSVKIIMACWDLSFADLLQLVETTYSKPVDNKF